MSAKSKSEGEQSKEWSRLMASAQAGDQVAYRALLADVSDKLRGYLMRRLRDGEVVEDILQEVLLGIHSARHTYEIDRPFAPWMYAIARYKLMDYFRAKKKDEVLLMIEDLGPETFQMELEDGGDVAKKLVSLIELLPKKQKEVLILLKIDGLSIKEAAQKLDASESAVKVNAHRAYQALRKKIEEQPL